MVLALRVKRWCAMHKHWRRERMECPPEITTDFTACRAFLDKHASRKAAKSEDRNGTIVRKGRSPATSSAGWRRSRQDSCRKTIHCSQGRIDPWPYWRTSRKFCSDNSINPPIGPSRHSETIHPVRVNAPRCFSPQTSGVRNRTRGQVRTMRCRPPPPRWTTTPRSEQRARLSAPSHLSTRHGGVCLPG